MLLNVIHKDCIYIDQSFRTKEELFLFASEKAFEKKFINNIGVFNQALIDRENATSTELKPGIAIPHAKIPDVNELFVLIFLFKNKKPKFKPGLGSGVDIVFLIGAKDNDPEYIHVLGGIARLFSNEEFVEDIKKSLTSDEIFEIIESNSIGEKDLESGRTRYQIVLSLNIKFSHKKLNAMFMELGISQPVSFQGENFRARGTFGLSFLGFSNMGMKLPGTENTTIFGITDDIKNVMRLNNLLKEEGINLKEPGVGALYSIELHNCFGGEDPEIDF